jgi:5-methylcytosine-specific restriction endonuclease McrA
MKLCSGCKQNKSFDQILVQSTERRSKTRHLVRAMIEMGIPQKCSECPVDTKYNGKPITLQVDHINGDWRDNRLENLRFLCPNCHSQTDTFGTKNIGG